MKITPNYYFVIHKVSIKACLPFYLSIIIWCTVTLNFYDYSIDTSSDVFSLVSHLIWCVFPYLNQMRFYMIDDKNKYFISHHIKMSKKVYAASLWHYFYNKFYLQFSFYLQQNDYWYVLQMYCFMVIFLEFQPCKLIWYIDSCDI